MRSPVKAGIENLNYERELTLCSQDEISRAAALTSLISSYAPKAFLK